MPPQSEGRLQKFLDFQMQNNSLLPLIIANKLGGRPRLSQILQNQKFIDALLQKMDYISLILKQAKAAKLKYSLSFF